ncbi:MAG TPA: hypothetical protein VK638_14810 [Edaphobacter sp.]|jgi:hypothetical protein|nr:hypothetical protein [Edaphobacter sp.]
MIQAFFTRVRLRRLQAKPQPEIRSRWVQTADERCPIACTWFTLPESSDEQDDDPGSTWPALLRFGWRAGVLSRLCPLPQPQPNLYGTLEA